MEDVLIVVLGFGFIVPFIILFIRFVKKETDKTDHARNRLIDKISVAEREPISPVVPIKHGSPEKAKVIKTLYRYNRYIPETGSIESVRWRCFSCETENYGPTDYCKLCGSVIRREI